MVGGVPSKAFKVPAEKLKAGAICINVAQHMNFGEGTEARCALVPAMGKVTISILARNLLRLYDNFHAPEPAPTAPMAPTTTKAWLSKKMGKLSHAGALGALLAVAVVGVGAFLAGVRYASRSQTASALSRVAYPYSHPTPSEPAISRVGYPYARP